MLQHILRGPLRERPHILIQHIESNSYLEELNN